MDIEVKDAIAKKGNKLFIGMSACRITDRYHLIQCYQCQEFGHRRGSEKCDLNNSGKEICLYCTNNHKSKECPIKKNGSAAMKCNNCFKSKDNRINKNCDGHATNSFVCPILQLALKNTMNKTIGDTYRNDVPKNSIIT